jgi:hypothetical protein
MISPAQEWSGLDGTARGAFRANVIQRRMLSQPHRSGAVWAPSPTE